MKKKCLRKDNFQLPCGQARPGQKLASLGKIMGKVCQDFNEKTKEIEAWKIVNVKIKNFSDGTYKLEVKGRITSGLIKRAAGEKKIISHEKLKEIAAMQIPYLNTEDLGKAQKIIAGTARSAGIKIEG